jgi:hypothetical protein
MNRWSIFFATLFILSGCLPANLPQQSPGAPTSLSLNATEQAVTEEHVQSLTSPADQAQAGVADSQWIALIGLDWNVWLVDAVSGEKKQITQDGTPKTGTSTANVRTYYSCFSWPDSIGDGGHGQWNPARPLDHHFGSAISSNRSGGAFGWRIKHR